MTGRSTRALAHFTRDVLCWALLASIAATPAFTAEAARQWTLGEPIFNYATYPIPRQVARQVESFYGWPENFDPTSLNPEIAQLSVAGGFNLVWINDLAQLPVAERYGLRAQFIIAGHAPQNNLFFDPMTGWPRVADVPAINALIDAFKRSPSAYSYFVMDEPDARYFQKLAAIVAYLKRRDPAHLAYINLFPPHERTSDLQAPNYDSYLKQFIETVHPALLSFDTYNLFEGNDRALFLGNMQTIARAASQAGIPFMAVVQGARFGEGARVPTASELRFLTYTPLAFGAQGVTYFNYYTGYGASSGGIAPFPDGRPSTVYTALQSLGPLFKRYALRLRKVHWIATHLQGYVWSRMPRKMSRTPLDAAFVVRGLADDLEYSDGAPLKGLLLGYFGSNCETPACATQVFVENLDYSASKTFRVSSAGRLSVLDINTDSWKPSTRNYVDVTLGPGDGVLIGRSSAVEHQ